MEASKCTKHVFAVVLLKDILIISTLDDTPRFEALLGDGSQYGISLSYKV